MLRARSLAALVTAFVACVACAPARALASPPHEREAPPRTPEVEPAEHASDVRGDGLAPKLAILAGVGLPRPLAIEGGVALGRSWLIGAEYSALPETTAGAVSAGLWAAAADLRFFPLRGPFFIGLRGGYQELSASATLHYGALPSYAESMRVATWWLNPRVGFLWTPHPFAIGIDAGVQLPLTASVSRGSSLADLGVDVDTGLTRAGTTLGRSVLPTIDLLRVGLVL